MMASKTVMVIGAGVGGLATSNLLADLGINIVLIEKKPFLGGHVAQFTCKATDECAQCGACLLEKERVRVLSHARISTHCNSRITEVQHNPHYNIAIQSEDALINAGSGRSTEIKYQVDAVIAATGFKAYQPVGEPFGYGRFPNVITNLQLEAMLRRKYKPQRPSDKQTPTRIAFIQCVGSRDLQLNHLWCSKVCCGSSLRMAHYIKHQLPDSRITVFYIDIQSFRKNFQKVFAEFRNELRLVRITPGDIFENDQNDLVMTFFDPTTGKEAQEKFNMVVLAVGIAPNPDSAALARKFGMDVPDSVFFNKSPDMSQNPKGFFWVGTTQGPMSISETISDAHSVVRKVLKYLEDR